jgi:hypothetical protein
LAGRRDSGAHPPKYQGENARRVKHCIWPGTPQLQLTKVLVEARGETLGAIHDGPVLLKDARQAKGQTDSALPRLA